jgi:DNA-binding FadR family transcriptional regulator
VSRGIADRIITAIAVGAYSPAERLPPERELAVLLGVSRVTVREALQRVSELGLIESRRGRGGGTFVTSLSWEDVAPETARRTLEVELPRLRELFDYRCLVEGTVARAATERRSAEDVARMKTALEEFRRADGMAEARRLDRQLHALVGAAAKNPHLTALSARLTVEVTLGFGSEPYLEEFFERALAEHEELIGHVVRGEAEAAGRAAQSHFAMTLEEMQVGLRRASQRSSPGA